MNCKNCGGVLHIENGAGVCQNCGTALPLDNIYENIDVCICYEESDANGRRTRDSLIAQEVYNKLEENKLSTFYERISADGLIGDDLEGCRIAAIYRAKIVIVLGATVENFAALEEKYGKLLSTKTVVPFCVDINPGQIPKTLSKIQAICYSTIGWDKDLVTGICNFLGREVIAEKKTFRWKFPKKKHIIIGVASFVALVAIVLSVLLILKNISNNGAATTATIEETTEPNTPQGICEWAAKYMEEGDLVKALTLLNRFPDYPDAADKMMSIYQKYEGCYQINGTSVQLRFTDNTTAKVEVNVQKGEENTAFSVSADVYANDISGKYVDNHKNSGTVTITLENTGFQFVMGAESDVKIVDVTFTDENKVDQPSIEISQDTLMKWYNEYYSYEQITNLGYTFESLHTFDASYSEQLYRIKYTEIYVSIGTRYLEDIPNSEEPYKSNVICSICAPADLIAQSLVGKINEPYISGDYIYRPGYYLNLSSMYDWAFSLFDTNSNIETEGDSDKKSELIAGNTMVAIIHKNGNKSFWEEQVDFAYKTKIKRLVREKYKLEDKDYAYCEKITSNDTHYLYAAYTEDLYDNDTRAWYKVNTSDHSIAFDREGKYETKNYSSSYYYASDIKIKDTLWFSEYIDYAKAFPDLFNIEYGSAQWKNKMESVIEDKVIAYVKENYNCDLRWVNTIAQNDTHILVCPWTSDDKTLWVKGNCQDGSIEILGQYPYSPTQISKYYWFKEHSDLAQEFPELYGDPDEVNPHYLSGEPFSLEISGKNCDVHTEPSYSAETVEWLSEGTYTIVEVQPDAGYRPWGKLESGQGWVCLEAYFD